MVVPSEGPFCCVQRQGDLMSVPQAVVPDPRDTTVTSSSPSSEVPFFPPYTKDFKNECKRILAEFSSVENSDHMAEAQQQWGWGQELLNPCFVSALLKNHRLGLEIRAGCCISDWEAKQWQTPSELLGVLEGKRGSTGTPLRSQTEH